MLTRILMAAALGLVVSTAASVASAQESSRGNPFALGGPLAPWTSPLPALAPAAMYVPRVAASAAAYRAPVYVPGVSSPATSWYIPNGSAPTTASTPAPSTPSSVYVPGLTPPASANPAPSAFPRTTVQTNPQADHGVSRTSEAKKESRTYVSVLLNPALAYWGRMAGRIEIAPLAAHAAFFEFAKWDLAVSYEALGQSVSRQVPIWEYGFGYHCYPQGRGVSGFYFGPRLIFAHGETDEAVGSAKAWGADLGYQFVVAEHLVFNIGLGVVHLTAKAEAKPGVVSQVSQAVSGSDTTLAGVDLNQSVDKWLPLPTLGIGAAF